MDFHSQFELIEELAFVDIDEISRISFNIIKIRGKKGFQVLRSKRKRNWPEGMWVPNNSSPLLDKQAFRLLSELIKMRNKEIEEKIDESTNST